MLEPLPISWDSETALIVPGLLAPPMVCLSWHDMGGGEGQGLEPHYEALDRLAGWLVGGRHFLGVNIAYDFGVAASEAPELLPYIFEAYAQGRVRDLSIDQKLIDIAKGRFQFLNKKKGSYSLQGIAKRHKIEMEKEDTPRLTYGRLRGRPISAYSEAEVKYALLDAAIPAQIHLLHREIELDWATQYDADKPLLANGPKRAYAAFALHLASCWGVHTNPERCQALEQALDETIDTAGDTLRKAGLLRVSGTKDTKAAKALMERVCAGLGLPLRTTKTGATSLDRDACEASGDPVLIAYTTYARADTLRARVRDLGQGSGAAPLQPSYSPIVDTGRTSCYKGKLTHGTQLQNMPTLPGSRETLEPRPGCIFFGSDYDAAEVHTLGQTLVDWFGSSVLADTLNAGLCPHVRFGAALHGITYEQADASPDRKLIRTGAKPGVFGIPGGMGAATFQAYAAGYDVYLSLSEAKHHIALFKAENPDVARYLRIIGDTVNRGVDTVCLPYSNRWRGGLTYASMANGFFQSLSAAGGLDALCEVQRLCYTVPSSPLYGARVWGWVHDEILGEARIEQAPEAAEELSRVMSECMNRYTPDVPTGAEPAIFWRWAKGTDPARDSKGRLVPSDPENDPIHF